MAALFSSIPADAHIHDACELNRRINITGVPVSEKLAQLFLNTTLVILLWISASCGRWGAGWVKGGSGWM